MTEQAMPNPVELYQTATKATQQIIASVKPGMNGTLVTEPLEGVRGVNNLRQETCG